MSKLFFKLLTPDQKAVFEKLKIFKKIGLLGGGTALMLQIAHRYSFDFDILGEKSLEKKLLLLCREAFGFRLKPLVDTPDELSFLSPQKIKVSFVHFPFPPLHPPVATPSLPLLNLLDLASNKAYTVGRRGEYRDYVDLFFLLKKGFSLKKIIQEAKKRFAGAFSEKLFLEQLIYFGDLVDFKVEFIKKSYPSEQILQFFKREVKKEVKNL